MAASREFQALRTMVAELSALLEGGGVPKPLRAESRQLAMDAWLLESGPKRTAEARRQAEAMARRIDSFLVRAAPVRPSIGGSVIRRMPPAIGVPTVQDGPLIDRLAGFEASVEHLASRTRRMVEHAEATAGASLPRKAPAEGAGRKAGGREDREPLELVWGEMET